MDIPPNQTIYINNLEEKIKKDVLKASLRAIFEQFGTILDIVATRNLKLKGQAWVVFEDITAATNAMRIMQGFRFFDKPMRITYAKTKSDVIAKREGTYKPREKRKKAEEAKPVLEKKQKLYNQKNQMKQLSMHPTHQNVPNNILFVQNLPEATTDMMISMLFQQFPGFHEVRMVESRPGIAFVEFENEHQAGMALNGLQGFRISPTNAMHVSFANK